MKVDSLKHKEAKRVHIPSKQEAGIEPVPEQVVVEFPLNRVIHRGQDPELYWIKKYGTDNRETHLQVDIRSLYRHEHLAPEVLIKRLYRIKEDGAQHDMFINELFGNALQVDELEKPGSYYRHTDGWTNRLIQGDSLLVMISLLEREGMAGKVQMIYIDPPYGIKYGSNWQMHLNDRNVKDGDDASLTGEPEVIKAFRDTWELGIHSYLSYLRERLLVARELLTDSGSCFVQISDENVHLVRCVMDEVFGSENFVSLISIKKTGLKGEKYLDSVFDYLIWYGKNTDVLKFRRLLIEKEIGVGKGTGERYDQIELQDGSRRAVTLEEKSNPNFLRPLIKNGAKLYQLTSLTSESSSESTSYEVAFEGRKFFRTNWKTNFQGMENLIRKGRVVVAGKTIRYLRYFDDFPATPIPNYWDDTGISDKQFVVQTSTKIVQRCLLMTTDPGDLVLDPTCGSGTTAYVAEQWGRRWITIDTSRIALNIAKTRLMTATFPWYKLYDQKGGDIRQGFIYKKVPHITLKSLANDEPPEEETLYDQPEVDRKKLRVSGPFTVETLQNFEPLPPEELDCAAPHAESLERFEARVFEHLKSAGVKNGIRDENAVFTRINRLASSYLHAEGFYDSAAGERKAYIHVGPKYGTVSKQAVNETIKECREKGDADWLLILGFAFESDIANQPATTKLGSFEVTKVRMHDDLLQEGLLKRDKKAASFVTIGEPDIRLHVENGEAVVEVCGLDIYDPIRDEVKPRSVADIAYWIVDDNYDRSNFIVRQVFFCGGDKDEFEKWKKGLSNLAKQSTKRKAERTLRIELDDEAFERLYGFKSHSIPVMPGRRIAVRVISQFGEESTKVLTVPG